MGGGVGEAAGVLAERQPRRLQRAMDSAHGDARIFEKGELEGGVVGDDVDAFEQLQHAGPGVVEINDEDAIAAGVDLQQADTGAARIQPGLPGALDLVVDPDARILQRGDLRRRGLQPLQRLERAGQLHPRMGEFGDPFRHFLDRRGLDVDRDPFRSLQHRLEQLPRLGSFGAIDDADGPKDFRGRAAGGGADSVEHLDGLGFLTGFEGPGLPRARQTAVLLREPTHLYAGKGDDQEHRRPGVVDAGARIRRDMQDKAAGAKTGAFLPEVASAPIVRLTDHGDISARRLEPQHMIEQVPIVVIALIRPVADCRDPTEIAGIA